MEEMVGMKINPELTKIVEEAGLLQKWTAEAVANAEAKLKRSEQEREQAVQKQERLMRERELVMRDVERLKREIATLKRAARAKA
jgi:predicted transcriptional regulator